MGGHNHVEEVCVSGGVGCVRRARLVRSSSRMYEASCHEGNYSMAGMLQGARALEARAVKARKP